MRKSRWLAGWRKSAGKPVFYHVISRVVDRRFAFGVAEKEKFRTLMRLQEKFTGCRATAYCLMDNHFHMIKGQSFYQSLFLPSLPRLDRSSA